MPCLAPNATQWSFNSLRACKTPLKRSMQHFQNLTWNQASAKPELFSQSSPARSFQRGLVRAQRSVARAWGAFIPTMARMSPPTFRLSHSPSAAAERRAAARHATPRARRSGHTHRASAPLHCSSLVEVNYEFGNRK